MAGRGSGSSAGIQPFAQFYRALQSAEHATYAHRLHAKVRSPAAFDRLRRHLVDLYAETRVRHSFVDSAGQVFDCVPIDEQPALRRSGGKLARPPVLPPSAHAGPPSHTPLQFLVPGRSDRYGNEMNCPKGCVALRRMSVDELARFETLDHFMRKSPQLGRGKVPGPIAPQDPTTEPSGPPPHKYAFAQQDVANLGGRSFLNLWCPPVTAPGIFSLSQHWYTAGSGSAMQTAEAGWQVYPTLYGHARPVLFSYFTPDGYASGSYNTNGGHFVQYGAHCPVGLAFDQVSEPGGAQLEVQIEYRLSPDGWWLFIGGSDESHAVGYYPVALYGDGPLAKGAQRIVYGGETVGRGIYPPMGSGAMASGGFKEAAYHRSIEYFSTDGAATPAILAAHQGEPNAYTIDVEHSDDWGQYFYYGGPGLKA